MHFGSSLPPRTNCSLTRCLDRKHFSLSVDSGVLAWRFPSHVYYSLVSEIHRRPSFRPILLVLVGVVIGLILAGGIALWDANRKVQLLASLDFRIHDPGIPENVLTAIRNAELKAYDDMGLVRKAVEDIQDSLALLWPGLAFSYDFSIGPYCIKASTVRETLDFALDEKYLTFNGERSSRHNEVLPIFALQPSINDWQASVLLEYLRQRHPALRNMKWEVIAADPNAIAKLYSGYMGAGGNWAQWKSDLVPGAVSRDRLGYNPATGQYAAIALPK